MKKLFFCLAVLLFSLAGCVQQNKLSEPVVESIESELFRLEVEIPYAQLESGDNLKVSSTLTYLGDEPIELVHANPPILLSMGEQGGGTEDIALTTEMAPRDVIIIEESFTLPDPGIYWLKTETTSLRVNGEFIEGAGYENLESTDSGTQEIFESRLILEPIEITVE
ncbi:hypothetical protein [Planococcus sp. S3-L1]|uniref:hypothetical protein n=1 Tax=Planococcus sp. S3-L1 TaxID=3046200 RepID=UPI0024B9D42A|nr:hypothetical protein [Planococcus sp. S3-L1]MDJ0332705.1 hypothetical protein [Planococcus sp. S3-L1]